MTVFKLPEIPAEVTALRAADDPDGTVYVRNEEDEWQCDYALYTLGELLDENPEGLVPVNRGDLYQQAIRYFRDHGADNILFDSTVFRYAEAVINRAVEKETM